jgi:hypothetical protein
MIATGIYHHLQAYPSNTHRHVRHHGEIRPAARDLGPPRPRGGWGEAPPFAGGAAAVHAGLVPNAAPAPQTRRDPPLVHSGTTPGSPPGVPGGGITGMTPPPTGGVEMPGSMPAGGQITPLERDKLIAQIGAAGGFSCPGEYQAAGSRLAVRVRYGREQRRCGAILRVGCACEVRATRQSDGAGGRRRVIPQLATACRAEV